MFGKTQDQSVTDGSTAVQAGRDAFVFIAPAQASTLNAGYASEKYSLDHILENINVSSPSTALYRLYEPKWEDVIVGADFVRDQVSNLLERILAPQAAHELIPIIGPSGFGKTTLLKRLAIETQRADANLKVFYIDGKAQTADTYEAVSSILNSDADISIRKLIFCDNAINIDISGYMELCENGQIRGKTTVIATYQPNEYVTRLGLHRETVMLGIDGKHPYSIPHLTSAERDALIGFLVDRGVTAEPAKLDAVKKASTPTFEYIFSELVSDARLSDRIDKTLMLASKSTLLRSVLEATAISYSLGIPLPIEIANNILNLVSTGNEYTISNTELHAVGILVSDDSLRLHHERVANEIVSRFTAMRSQGYCTNLLVAAISPSDNSVIFLQRLCAALLRSNSGDSLAAKLFLNVANDSDLRDRMKSRFLQLDSAQAAIQCISLFAAIKLPGIEKLLSEFLDHHDGKINSIADLFIRDISSKFTRGSSVILKTLVDFTTNPSARFSANSERPETPTLDDYYFSALARISIFGRAPGFSTVLECLSKLRRVDDIDNIIQSNIDDHLFHEKSVCFLIEYARQINSYDLIERILPHITANILKYPRARAVLNRCRLKWSSLKIFEESMATAESQLNVEAALIAGVEVPYCDALMMNMLWRWIFKTLHSNETISVEKFNLLEIITGKVHAIANSSVADLIAVELICRHLRPYLHGIELAALVNYGLLSADRQSMPAIFFWTLRGECIEQLKRSVDGIHSNNKLALISFVVRVSKLRACFATSDLVEIFGYVKLKCQGNSLITELSDCLVAMCNCDMNAASTLWKKLSVNPSADHNILSLYANYLTDYERDLESSATLYSEILKQPNLNRSTNSRYLNNLGMIFIKRWSISRDPAFRAIALNLFMQASRVDYTNKWAKRNLDTYY
jgi:Cdc6-like AAA superfamily ATPase